MQELHIGAYQYAAKAHNGQLLPGSDLPYIVHLSLVSMEIKAASTVGSRNLEGDFALQCALLHDTVDAVERGGWRNVLISNGGCG